MLSPPEAHYSKTRMKVLPSNDFDKDSPTIFIFWGMNLYFRPNKYLKRAINIWRCIYPCTQIYISFFSGIAKRAWAELFPFWQVTGGIWKHILTSQSTHTGHAGIASSLPGLCSFQLSGIIRALLYMELLQHYPSPPPYLDSAGEVFQFVGITTGT